MSTLSSIPLSFKKAYWLSSITDASTLFILSANTFDITLYIAPTSEIGRYCSSLVGSLTLGTNAMNDALHPFESLPAS